MSISFLKKMALVGAAIVGLQVSTSAEYAKGFILGDYESGHDKILLSAAPAATSLPSSHHLPSLFPQVGNQRSQGSCVGWAVAYATRTFHEKSEIDWNITQNKHIFSPAFIYNQFATGHQSGIAMEDALNLLVTDGCATLSQMPYNEHDWTTQPNWNAKNTAKRYKASDWNYVYRNDRPEPKTTVIDKIKAELTQGNPVLIGIHVHNSFYALRDGDVQHTTDLSDGGHALVITGYNDDKPTGSSDPSKAKGAFKVINSWGTAWGTDGYGFIEYNTLYEILIGAYVLHDKTTHPQKINSEAALSSGDVVSFKMKNQSGKWLDTNAKVGKLNGYDGNRFKVTTNNTTGRFGFIAAPTYSGKYYLTPNPSTSTVSMVKNTPAIIWQLHFSSESVALWGLNESYVNYGEGWLLGNTADGNTYLADAYAGPSGLLDWEIYKY